LVHRHEISDVEWEAIRGLVPARKATGRPLRDPRSTLNAMFWILRTGAPWRDLPERYGPWQSAYHRFNRWRAAGVLARVLEKLQLKLNEEGCLDTHLWLVDGTSIRATRAAAGARRKGGARKSPQITR
jgi:transposase